MKKIYWLIALIISLISFGYYLLGLMHLKSLLVSGFCFFISLTIMIRLIRA